jgi:chitinase
VTSFLPQFRAHRIVLYALVLLVLAAPVSSFAGPLHSARRLVVGYFPSWGLYYPQPYYVKALITNGSATRLDQINYAQGAVRDGRCSLADPNADLNAVYTDRNSVNGRPDSLSSPFRGYFHQLEELKRRYPRIKILISLEGKAEDFANDASLENRRAFVASCVDMFLRGHFAPGIEKPGIFDGIDVDWESPQVGEAANFRALLEEFRGQMDALRPGMRLSIAVDQSPDTFQGTNFGAIAPLVDQVGIMNYDYAGPWSATTGFLAPLFSGPTRSHPANSIERSLASYKAAGVPAAKLLMGIPFYGYSWTAVGNVNDGLFQAGRAIHADQPYHYIRDLASPFSAHRDVRSQAPWLFDGQTFWTFEDPVSVRYKVSYARHQKLGGVMIWELSGDTQDAELLSIVHSTLRHPLKARVFANTVSVYPVPADSAPPKLGSSEHGAEAPSN